MAKASSQVTSTNNKRSALSPESVEFMISRIGQMEEYLRHTTNRIGDQVQFYLTISTALLGGMFLLITSNSGILIELLVLSIGFFVSGIIGFLTFSRICTIKTQAAMHSARIHRYCRYFTDFDSHLSHYVDEAAAIDEDRRHHSPFSPQIVAMLRLFCVLNSTLLALAVVFTTVLLLYIASDLTIQINVTTLIAYLVIWLLGFAILYLIFSRQLSAKVAGAHLLYELLCGQDSDQR